ncbi:MAG: response regulator [Nitrospinae bacterium]|nr:response regulator [Nitrospinota bacterium]
MAQDITEIKLAEKELRAAKDEAEAATRLKDKFVSLVAHDLKSPLASIIGLLGLLGRDEASKLSGKDAEILRHVNSSGGRMVKMISELLDISRLQTGKIKPERKFIDANVEVSYVLGKVGSLAEGKGVKIMNEVPPGMRLYTDFELFGEVIQNLVTNAVKFSRKGDTVRIFTPEGRECSIAVADNGTGINKAMLPVLFRHDEKTSTPGTDGEMGTGFGLPLSHDIMKALGGSLTAESEEGKGSVFYADLPMVRPRVLIVDDEAAIRMVLRLLLSRIYVDTMEAENANQALSILEKEQVHLLIFDVMMPGMDGFEMLKRIKGMPHLKDIPVIMITADTDTKKRETAFRLGADDFVNKPLTPEDLIPRVKRFLA